MRFHLVPTIIIVLVSVAFVIGQKPELSVQTGHSGQVLTLAFTRDGRLLASGSVDQTIVLWNPATGNQLRALKGHTGTVGSIAFSPDDKQLASGSADNSIKIWEVASGNVKQTMKGHTLYVSSVAFSPDGKMLASGSGDQTVKLWDLATGRELRTLAAASSATTGMPVVVAFSPDGKTLATGAQVAKLWDVRTGSEIRTIKASESNSPTETPLAFSYDGKVLATGGKAVKLWDAATGNLVRTMPDGARALSFSPDQQTLAGTGGTETTLWNFTTGQTLQTLAGSQLGVDSVAFNLDGKLLAVGNSDNTVALWDSVKHQKIRVLEGRIAAITTVAASADDKVLASALEAGIAGITRQDTIKIWDPITGQLVRSLVGRNTGHSIGLSGDGAKLTAGGSGSSLSVWNVSQSEAQQTITVPRASRFVPERVALSPDGKLIAAGGRDNAIKLWDAGTGRELSTLTGHVKSIRHLVFSPDNKLLASGGQDTAVKIWSVATGKELKTLAAHSGGVTALAFSADGKRVVSGSQDRMILIWDIAQGDSDAAYLGHKGWVNAVALSPDGRRLASGSEDGEVRIWEVASRSAEGEPQVVKRPLYTLTGHTGPVNSLIFNSGGKLVVSGSSDGSMKLWDVAAGMELASLFSLDEQDWLVLTPDGLFDGSPSAWNQILWRFSSNLFDVAPVELFFNDYYHPGLLADLYAGKRPVAPQNIAQRDRRQPVVKLSVNEAQVAAATVRSRTIGVKVEVSQAPAGAEDIRLFRNGALVKAWRGDVLKGQARVVLEAQIPIVAGANQLTAYGFNRDNIKSADATIAVTGNDSLKQPGTLYILAIAVNKYANSQFDLRYAVADANDFAAELQRQETKLKNYARTEIISLQDAKATKANILQALGGLATRVKPEDAVVVYFAGHGTAQQNQFYLITHDLGFSGARNQIDAAALQTIVTRSISDRELERSFESVDAGQFLLVIDACNSGQALEAAEKRRGPMNSRGLAQLAYEKGMYVLTAAQSYQAAMEAAKLGHGYLTFALVEEGLKTSAADLQPVDGQVFLKEWLDYATQRVPQMQEEKLKEGQGRQLEQVVAFVPGDEKTDPAKRNLQRPRVFYRRELGLAPFIVAKPGPSN
ncbi:MAG TPA: caspase family protein [Pyrinomonadaceae bacterium]|nr:caspase family protein [Pyrinomonadaceae bacterium]